MINHGCQWWANGHCDHVEGKIHFVPDHSGTWLPLCVGHLPRLIPAVSNGLTWKDPVQILTDNACTQFTTAFFHTFSSQEANLSTVKTSQTHQHHQQRCTSHDSLTWSQHHWIDCPHFHFTNLTHSNSTFNFTISILDMHINWHCKASMEVAKWEVSTHLVEPTWILRMHVPPFCNTSNLRRLALINLNIACQNVHAKTCLYLQDFKPGWCINCFPTAPHANGKVLVKLKSWILSQDSADWWHKRCPHTSNWPWSVKTPQLLSGFTGLARATMPPHTDSGRKNRPTHLKVTLLPMATQTSPSSWDHCAT